MCFSPCQSEGRTAWLHATVAKSRSMDLAAPIGRLLSRHGRQRARMVAEGLKVARLHVVICSSLGSMHSLMGGDISEIDGRDRRALLSAD